MNESSGRNPAARLLLEMLVVVASILIAFSLDAWWDRRAEDRAEAAHLRALRSDFEQNVISLKALVETEERIAEASRRLLVIATSPAATAPGDSIGGLLGQVFNSVRFDPVMGAYEAVVGSGGLAQIQNDSLRLALAGFASAIEGRYNERWSDELYLDFIRSYTGRLGFVAAVIDQDSSALAQAAAVSRQALLEDPGFREHLALRYLAEDGVARMYRGLLEQAERVLELTGRPPE